jgi:hypothetical protein
MAASRIQRLLRAKHRNNLVIAARRSVRLEWPGELHTAFGDGTTEYVSSAGNKQAIPRPLAPMTRLAGQSTQSAIPHRAHGTNLL